MIQTDDDLRLWNEFKATFQRTALEDIRKALAAEVGVGTIALTILAVESLSGFHIGKRGDDVTLAGFARDYLGRYHGLVPELYACVRNGLLHDYTIKMPSGNRRFLITLAEGEQHLTAPAHDANAVYFNRVAFARDVLDAAERFFNDVESNQPAWDRAVKRLGTGFLAVRWAPEFTSPARPGPTVTPQSLRTAGSAAGRVDPTTGTTGYTFTPSASPIDPPP